MDTAISPCNPCESSATVEVRAPSPPSSPQAAQARLPPPRATLILPDAMAVGLPGAGTSPGSGDQRIGTRSAVSSRMEEIGRHGGRAHSLNRQPELAPGSATGRFSRTGTRTRRVLKTSSDFRDIIRRVYKVGAKIVLARQVLVVPGIVFAEDIKHGNILACSSLPLLMEYAWTCREG